MAVALVLAGCRQGGRAHPGERSPIAICRNCGLDKSVTNLVNNPKYASSVTQIQTLLGIKLKDVAAIARSDMAIYGTSSGVGVLIKTPDPAKASVIVNKAVTLLSSFGKVKKVSVSGVSATELSLGNTAPIHLYLGVKGRDLFVTTDVTTLPGGSKLSSDPVYSAATKALPVPSANDGVLFID
ncbi:MAG: hypothetical protein ABSB57_02125, partial [Dehalococcoidia bacterium]